jgi:hypothetical protein
MPKLRRENMEFPQAQIKIKVKKIKENNEETRGAFIYNFAKLIRYTDSITDISTKNKLRIPSESQKAATRFSMKHFRHIDIPRPVIVISFNICYITD